jgi:hypothetical protein
MASEDYQRGQVVDVDGRLLILEEGIESTVDHYADHYYTVVVVVVAVVVHIGNSDLPLSSVDMDAVHVAGGQGHRRPGNPRGIPHFRLMTSVAVDTVVAGDEQSLRDVSLAEKYVERAEQGLLQRGGGSTWEA